VLTPLVWFVVEDDCIVVCVFYFVTVSPVFVEESLTPEIELVEAVPSIVFFSAGFVPDPVAGRPA